MTLSTKVLPKFPSKFKYWKRYIDDIFFVSSSPLDNIIPYVNSMNDSISFTLEEPNDYNLSFLDTAVSYHQDSSSFSTKYYSKILHSGHLLPWESHVPLSRKINLLKSENLRAHRLCSSHDHLIDAINFLKNRFRNNGYPDYYVQKYVNLDKPATRPKIQINAKNNIYRRIPFINEIPARKVRNELKRLTIVNIIPTFVGSNPLSQQLRFKSNLPCH